MSVFVPTIGRSRLIADNHFPSQCHGPWIRHEEVTVVKLAPMSGGYLLLRVEPLLNGRRYETTGSPLDDVVDLIDLQLGEFPQRLYVQKTERCTVTEWVGVGPVLCRPLIWVADPGQ